MKFELNFNLSWMLQKVRLLFLVAVFWALYTYLGNVWAFMWGLYFILNDLSEVIDDLESMKTERSNAWKGLSHKRKDF